MSWDLTSLEASAWIVVGTRDKIVQVLILNANSQLHAVFLLNGDDGTVVKEYSCKSVIGHAVVNQKRVPKQYVFERKLGKLLDALHHSDTGLVQTIATHDLNGHCTVASASPALGCGKATINLWVHDYSIRKKSLTSEYSWSLSHMLKHMFALLVHLSALAVIMCFLITNYFDTVATWSVDLAQQMKSMHVFTFWADNLHRSAKVFKEVPDIQEEVHEKNNILMLHELAGKLMEAIWEAKRDVDEDLHHVAEHDDIAVEAERVFYQAVKGTQRGHDDWGKQVLVV
ncbi:hypothetical protein BDR05DRAFT_950975 [Suillus weaverae]|nr:hypothetical protein BDR05DRAFT_950975 [Suillus weaverae]